MQKNTKKESSDAATPKGSRVKKSSSSTATISRERETRKDETDQIPGQMTLDDFLPGGSKNND